MTESIPDVILRLARRHIPADAAMPANAPAQDETGMSDRPLDAFAPLPREQPNESVEEYDPNTTADLRSAAESPDHEPIVTQPVRHDLPSSILNPPLPPAAQADDLHQAADQMPRRAVPDSGTSGLHTAGGSQPAGAPQVMTTSRADEPAVVPSDNGSFADAEPAFQQSHELTPSFSAGSDLPRHSGDRADDSFQPVARSSTSSDGSPDQSPVEAVSETSRQLEQTARDFQTSLTRLFTTQIETLQHLRDRVDEQERRWVEQQSARRASF